MSNEVITSKGQLDWLTVTSVSGSMTDELKELKNAIVEDHLPSDAIGDGWKGLGYSGYNYGPLKFGRRKGDEAILIISGPLADAVGETYSIPHDRVTRVDFQVTIRLDPRNPHYASAIRNRLLNLPESANSGKILTYISSNTGDTLNFGKRSKKKFLRLYDKSKDIEGAERGEIWRYEVELKKDLAQSAMAMFNASNSRHEFIAEQVFAAFDRVGAKPPYKIDGKAVAIEVAQKVTTVDGKLGWISRCVAPVVSQLMLLGYEEEVLSSLSLKGIRYRKEK